MAASHVEIHKLESLRCTLLLRYKRTHTHEAFKEAGDHEEPEHAGGWRRPAPRHKPQQQIGEDSQWSGQNQPVRQSITTDPTEGTKNASSSN